MSIKEALFVIFLAAFVTYAHRSRARPGDPGWHPLGYTQGRPVTVWEVLYVLTGAALTIWLMRVGHLLWFGSG
jgi:hypothetical protein